jgi:hypothetical protein
MTHWDIWNTPPPRSKFVFGHISHGLPWWKLHLSGSVVPNGFWNAPHVLNSLQKGNQFSAGLLAWRVQEAVAVPGGAKMRSSETTPWVCPEWSLENSGRCTCCKSAYHGHQEKRPLLLRARELAELHKSLEARSIITSAHEYSRALAE